MKIYNTLSRKTDEIKPIYENKIKLYTCGLTVYSQPHIGNWVAYIYWDVLVRTLKNAGYDVTRVQNITDVGNLKSDEYAGEDKKLQVLTLDPSVSTLTTDCVSCTSANVTKGSSTAYEQGVTDSVTLLSAAAGSDDVWRGYLTGIAASQTIPAETPVDTYTLNLTLTATAL